MTVLFLTLVIINAVAVWGILSARRTAENLAIEDLRLQIMANARSLEAVLSSRRGDFIFLSQSPQLADAPLSLSSKNPIARKWGRLDVEGTLLLFLVAHPEVERLVIRDSQLHPLIAAGRRDEAPVLLPPHDFETPWSSGNGLLVGAWPLRSRSSQSGTLEAVLDISHLIQVAAPGMPPKFYLEQQAPLPDGFVAHHGKDTLLMSIPVRDNGWPQPVNWALVCREPRISLMASVTLLADRYRTTVILNLIVMLLAFLLGIVGIRQVRRTIALEEEARQQARVRELERQVMHNERLASVGRLAAGMAHEINNPLEGMTNYLGLLEGDLRSGQTEGSLELVGSVREGLERMAGVIRQVLTFSDPGTAAHSPLDLNDVLGVTLRFVASNTAFRHTEVIARLAEEPLRIVGNRVTLGQLFLNLLMNASQVQPDGGQIEVASFRYGDNAVVLIADCGPGISTEALPRIFEPFYSTRGSTGLGLSVCHGIVTEHRGRISAENRIEGGAIFKLEFPLENQPQVQADLGALCSS